MRLFAKINGKEDGDITKNEFNNALDNNILPIRYSQVTINEMFSLVKSDKILNRGVDKFTFVFLDFNLRLFSVKYCVVKVNALLSYLYANFFVLKSIPILLVAISKSSYQQLAIAALRSTL